MPGKKKAVAKLLLILVFSNQLKCFKHFVENEVGNFIGSHYEYVILMPVSHRKLEISNWLSTSVVENTLISTSFPHNSTDVLKKQMYKSILVVSLA